MKHTFIACLFALGSACGVHGQGVRFGSSDTALAGAFSWARETALHYRGKPEDPVGPWYESALPPRNAFCMRDVSHQCVGAAILGLEAENKNMLTLFARNISGSKDWCSYWEMNRTGAPAPEDYRSDKEFWYNLNANFDVLSATWRLAAWTGDSSYLGDTVFRFFQDKSMDPYIRSWVLEPDSLLTRPAHPNAPDPYKETDAFDRCRGLPSYSEGIPNMKMGVDLIAALYRGMMTYAAIQRNRGKRAEAMAYERQAEMYRMKLESGWWDERVGRYHTWYSNDGKFGTGEGETFLLWFDALQDTARKRRTLEHLMSRDWNVENMSYFPCIFYREGYWDDGRRYILYLSDPKTARREYPEVSFGVVQGVVLGLMGVSVLPGTRTVCSLYQSNHPGSAWLENLPVLGTRVDLRHEGALRSTFTNKGSRAVKWRAAFSGAYKRVSVNGKSSLRLQQERTIWGRTISYVDIPVNPGAAVSVKVLRGG